MTAPRSSPDPEGTPRSAEDRVVCRCGHERWAHFDVGDEVIYDCLTVVLVDDRGNTTWCPCEAFS